MVQSYNTRLQQMILKITVRVQYEMVVRLIVADSVKENTVFTDRYYQFVPGETKDFFVRLPLVDKTVNILLFNNESDNVEDDAGIELLDISEQPLKKRLDLINLNNRNLRDFIFFAQQFSFTAGFIPDNMSYGSQCGKFQIDYLDAIRDENGNVIPTPASTFPNGLIQVAKCDFINMTVPMRIAILLHEYSHIYINKVPADEQEADKNSLLIFLCLGYPRLEATEAWVYTFINADSGTNQESDEARMIRMDKIQKFIQDFENKNYYINGEW